MAEATSQGPGWWQASDGLWYPPEQHPDYVAPAPEPGPAASDPSVPGPPPGMQAPENPPTMVPPVGQPPAPGAPPTFEAPPAYGAPPLPGTGQPVPEPTSQPGSSNNAKAFLGIGIAAVVALLGAAAFLLLGGDDDEGSDNDVAAEAAPESPEDPEEEPEEPLEDPEEPLEGPEAEPEDPQEEPEEPLEEPEEPGESPIVESSLSDLLPTGAETEVSYEYEYGDGTVYTVSIDGYNEIPVSEYSDESGTCFAIFGVMGADLPDSQFLADPYSTPEAGLIVDGQQFDSLSSYQCAVEDLNGIGFNEPSYIGMTDGSTSSFSQVIFVPSTTDPAVEAITLGDAFGDALYFFEPTTIETPTPVVEPGAPLAEYAPLQPTGEDGSYEWTDSYSGDSWDVSVIGVVPFEADSSNDYDGSCYGVVGTVTPTLITEGELSDPFSAPRVRLVQDGRNIASFFGYCNTASFDDAGYDYLFSAEVTLGTSFAFVEPIWVPAGSGPVEAIVVSDYESDVLFEATELDSIPPAP